MQSRAMERALADSGELQQGSNLGKGQVKAADFFLEPNIVTANQNSGGGGAGAAIGALGGLFGGGGRFVGGLVGGINVKKGEANVTLSVVNARTTEEYVVEGYARKKDISWGAGGGGGWWSGFAAAGGHGYQNTEIGQVIEAVAAQRRHDGERGLLLRRRAEDPRGGGRGASRATADTRRVGSGDADAAAPRREMRTDG